MKTVFSIGYYLFAGIVLLLGMALLTMAVPVPGGMTLKIVQSGSMEPAIETGSLIVVQPHGPYKVGDIITFGRDTQTAIPTTHRIVEIIEDGKKLSFVTKGDANEEADPNPVPMNEVIGTVTLAVPKAGYVIDFARQPWGMFFLIIIPAAAMIIDEIFSIVREVRKGLSRGVQRTARVSRVVAQETQRRVASIPPYRAHTKVSPRIGMDGVVRVRKQESPHIPRSIDGVVRYRPGMAALAAVLFLSALAVSNPAHAQFDDRESSSGNEFAAGFLDFTAMLDTDHVPLMCGDEESVAISLSMIEGSAEAVHKAEVEFVGGDPAFCSEIGLEATFEGMPRYDGYLLSFAVSEGDSPHGIYDLEFSLPAGSDDIPDGTLCTIAFNFTAWLADVPSPEESGWTDEEQVILTIEKKPLPDCPTCGNTIIIIENNNSSTVTNNASSSANTGGNSANGGAGGDGGNSSGGQAGDGGDGGDGGTIVTGDSTSTTIIENIVNQNVTEVSTGGCSQCSPCGSSCGNHDDEDEEDKYEHEEGSEEDDTQSMIDSIRDKIKDKFGGLFGD